MPERLSDQSAGRLPKRVCLSHCSNVLSWVKNRVTNPAIMVTASPSKVRRRGNDKTRKPVASAWEVVAVALGEAWILLLPELFPLSPALSRKGRGGKTVLFCRVCDGLFQYLGLFALVVDFCQEPEVVPGVPGVALQFQEVAAAQGWLVAVAGGQVVVAAVAFQGAAGQVFAAAAVGELAGVVVVFQIGQLVAAGFAFE